LNLGGQYQLFKTVPFYDENGKVNKILAVAENITEQKQKELELQKAKEAAEQITKELEEAQKTAGLANWSLDIETNEINWSAQLYRIYGYDPNLPIPPFEEHLEMFSKESQHLLTSSLARTQETGEPYEIQLSFCQSRW